MKMRQKRRQFNRATHVVSFRVSVHLLKQLAEDFEVPIELLKQRVVQALREYAA